MPKANRVSEHGPARNLSGGLPEADNARMYNQPLFPSILMEAERLNAIANALSDLNNRTGELRRYL